MSQTHDMHTMPYERPNIQRLAPYLPGEQPRPGDRVIKLNTNENPYPPAPAVLDAIHRVDAEQLRLYPQPQARAFRQAAAKVHNLDENQVIATNGGDELLRLAITVFCQPRPTPATAGEISDSAGLGYAVPSYSLYETLAQIHDTPITTIPLGHAFTLPDDFARQLNAAGCRLAVIVNPHAPSGRLEPLETLRAVAKTFRGVLLIDEAYVDFAQHDAVSLLHPEAGLDNVLLLRSLSKGYSLAGLRFGYGIGHRDLIAALDKARDSYNTDALAQAVAVAAIQHRRHAAQSCQRVIAERERVSHALNTLGCRVLPSQSNFLLVTPPADASSVYQSLKRRSILVRYFDQDRLRDKLRITIGTPAQNNALISTLTELTNTRPCG